jgi:hypothetical protein
MQLAANYQRVGNLEPRSINEALRMIGNQMGRRNLENIDKVPLLERKREILAGMAKGRMLATLKHGDESPAVENLPQREDKTRDAVAAEIGCRRAGGAS